MVNEGQLAWRVEDSLMGTASPDSASGADVGVWRNFLAEVRGREGPESYYQYTELEAMPVP